MTDFLGEYNGKPGACPMGPGILPVASDDGEHWRPISEVTWDGRAKEATIRIRPDHDVIWIAHQPPYTTSRLTRLLKDVDGCEDARIEVIGKSAQGRDLHLITVTAPDVDDRDKVTVWLQARQHAWESGTSYVMEGALRFITSDDPKARDLRRRAVFVFTPMVDPDGSRHGPGAVQCQRVRCQSPLGRGRPAAEAIPRRDAGDLVRQEGDRLACRIGSEDCSHDQPA